MTEYKKVEVAEPLPAGTNNIGDVDVASALPAGSNSIGTVVLGAGSAAIGTVEVSNLDATVSTHVINIPKTGGHDQEALVFKVPLRSPAGKNIDYLDVSFNGLIAYPSGGSNELTATLAYSVNDSSWTTLDSFTKGPFGAIYNIATILNGSATSLGVKLVWIRVILTGYVDTASLVNDGTLVAVLGWA